MIKKKDLLRRIESIETRFIQLTDFLETDRQEKCKHKWGKWEKDLLPSFTQADETKGRRCEKCNLIHIQAVFKRKNKKSEIENLYLRANE